MRKQILPILAITAMTAPAALAQITYEFSDLPVIGDQITRYRDTMTVYGPGPAGPNQQWNFPSPVTHEELTTSVVTVGSTPYAGSFGSSNMAMTNDNAAYLYLNVNSSTMISTGAAGDLLQNGGNMVAVFNPTLTVHNFPRQYEDNGEDTYFFQVETIDHGIPLVHSVRLRHYGHVFDTTDGYGQITTPVGTYECLRVKSTDFTLDSVWIRLFPGPPFTDWQLSNDFTGPGVSTSYSWLAKETKLAVAELTFDSIGDPKNFTWSSIPPDNPPTGIADAPAQGLKVYPQPSHSHFSVEWNGAREFGVMELRSIDGRLVNSFPVADLDRLTVDVTPLPKGVYLMRMLRLDGSQGEVRRIIVN